MDDNIKKKGHNYFGVFCSNEIYFLFQRSAQSLQTISKTSKTMNFQNHNSFRFRRSVSRLAVLFWLILFTTFEVWAQTQTRVPPVSEPEVDYMWWYITLFVLVVGLAGAAFWMLKSRQAEKEGFRKISNKEKMMSENNAWDANSLGLDKEMEWYRQHKKSTGNAAKKADRNDFADRLPKTGKLFNRSDEADENILEISDEVKENPETSKLSPFPVFNVQKLDLARPFAPLSLSNDEDLMSAIEQVHDELEEDEEIRDLAVRILTRFKTRNSIEALAQIALYDLSSNLRSKAVGVLADFDHESVFETILLCCADPTREVRAAAARGLFRLSFDRADAWTRIAETGDEFRMRQAARAAKEADLVKRSFDRIIHPDPKIAYEAMTLLALMMRAGETEEIFRAIENHNDSNVKLALVHIIGLTKQEKSLAALHELFEKTTISKELKEKIDEVIQSFDMIPA
jgi:hypothetical protein